MANAFLTSMTDRLRKAALAGAAGLSLMAFVAGCNDYTSANPPTRATPGSVANPNPGPTGPTGPITSTLQGAILFAESEDDMTPISSPSFALNSVGDVQVFVGWTMLSGDHQAEVKFIAPNGNVFMAKTVDLPNTGKTTIGNASGTWVSFPVGGTMITARELTGTWKVEATLDDAAASSASGRLTLSPAT